MEQTTREPPRMESRTMELETSTGDSHLRLIQDAEIASAASSPGWDIADRSDEEISERVAGLAGRISAATCEWLGYVAEADRRGLWAGFASTAAWLSWRCGIGPQTATDQIRVARALADLPVIRGNFAEGRLSYSQVRALIRGAGIVPEGELVELARHATGAQLERLVRALRRTVSEGEEDTAALRQRAHWRIDDDGSLVISARLSGEWAEAWMAALEQAQAQARRQSEGPVTQAAIMATIAGRALSADIDADIPAPTVGIVADLEALGAAAELIQDGRQNEHDCESGSDVSAETPRGAGSDVSAETPASSSPTVRWNTTGAPASITTLASLLHRAQVDLIAQLTDGTLVDLGRSRRRPSQRLTRAVLRRHADRCAHPHCRAKAHLHLHHVQHWARGGSTSLNNLIPLCGRHHRALHRGMFSIWIDNSGRGAARFRFTSASGTPVTAVAWADPRQMPGSHDCEDTDFDSAERAGRSMIQINGRAERMDLDYAVSVLLQDGSRARPA